MYLVDYIARALSRPWSRGWQAVVTRIEIMKQLLISDFWIPDLGFEQTRSLKFGSDIFLQGGLYTYRERDLLRPNPDTIIEQITELLLSYARKMHHSAYWDREHILSQYKDQYMKRSTPRYPATGLETVATECLRMMLLRSSYFLDSVSIVNNAEIALILTPGFMNELKEEIQRKKDMCIVMTVNVDETIQDKNDIEDMRWE